MLLQAGSSELEALLVKGASGLYVQEAAGRLLARHGYWLKQTEFHRFVELYGDPVEAMGIRWLDAVESLDAGDLPASAEAANVLRIAASIAEFYQVCLREAVEYLSRETVELVATAVMYAATYVDSVAQAKPYRP